MVIAAFPQRPGLQPGPTSLHSAAQYCLNHLFSTCPPPAALTPSLLLASGSPYHLGHLWVSHPCLAPLFESVGVVSIEGHAHCLPLLTRCHLVLPLCSPETALKRHRGVMSHVLGAKSEVTAGYCLFLHLLFLLLIFWKAILSWPPWHLTLHVWNLSLLLRSLVCSFSFWLFCVCPYLKNCVCVYF